MEPKRLSPLDRFKLLLAEPWPGFDIWDIAGSKKRAADKYDEYQLTGWLKAISAIILISIVTFGIIMISLRLIGKV